MMTKITYNSIIIEVKEYKTSLPRDIHLAGGDEEVLIILRRLDNEKRSYGILLSLMEYDSARMDGRRGLFPLESREKRKKKHAEIRRLLDISKKEYCKVMGYVGNLLSPYLRSANF